MQTDFVYGNKLKRIWNKCSGNIARFEQEGRHETKAVTHLLTAVNCCVFLSGAVYLWRNQESCSVEMK